MGTGKTATAKLLAKRLGMQYFSMDDEIEKREGMAILEIFKSKGEPYFRELEHKLSKDLADKSGLVIDAGGGVVLSEENIKNLRKNGEIFCLTATPEKILERTKKYSHRPLLNMDDPLGKIKELLELREPHYQAAADYMIDGTDLTIDEQADEIVELLKDDK